MPLDIPEERRLAAIMFTDIVGFSAHTHRDEAAALAMLDELQRLVRVQLALHNGREVKATGDGFLVAFPSALEAARCAVEIQRSVAERNSTLPPIRHCHLRIGVHVGDVVFRDADMYGDGVNIASRIEPLAESGGICLSGPVVDQVGNKLDLPLISIGTPALKNVGSQLAVYRVMLPWLESSARSSRKAPQQRPSAHVGRSRHVSWILAALVLLIPAGWAGWTVLSKHPAATPSELHPAEPSDAAKLLDPKRLLVLPFLPAGKDAEDGYFADGLTVDLITALSRLSDLKVVERAASFQYKGHVPAVKSLGSKHGVGFVLEGEISKAGSKSRVSVRLVDVADGTNRWSADFDPEHENLLDVRARIANEVARQLKVKLAAGDRAQLAYKPTDNPEAYKLYVLGKARWTEYSGEGFKASIRYYTEAIKKDPNYALAYAGLADTWIQLADGEWARPKESMAKAKDFAIKAQALDPNLAEAYVSLGTIKIFYDRDWVGAEKDFKRALQLDPVSNPDAYHFYGHYLEAVGRTSDAIASFQRGLQLDPLSPQIATELGWSYYKAGQYDRAIAQTTAALKANPEFGWVEVILADAYSQTGQLQEALSHIVHARSIQHPATPYTLSKEAHILAIAGHTKEARDKIEEMRTAAKKVGYLDPYFLAEAYAGLRDDALAIDCLYQAEEVGSIWMCWVQVDPKLRFLRPQPRFQELLRKMHLK